MASSLSEEDSGSLFEGMVLFSPSDLPPSPPTSPPPPLSPLTPSKQHQHQPPSLDEDLFSDLTLQTPESQSEDNLVTSTITVPPSPSLNRHTSSRKKKRAVRIGYARDTQTQTQTLTQTLTLNLPLTKDNDPSPPSNDRETLTLPLAKDEDVSTPSSMVEEGHDLSPQESLTKDETLSPAAFEEPPPQLSSSTASPSAEDGDNELFEDRLELVRARILRKLDGIRKEAGLLSVKRKELGTRRRKAVERLNLAVEEHKQLERELEEAVEAEDFERAERVSESVADKEKEKDGLAGELRKIELEYDEVDSEMQGVLECLIAAEEEGANLLEEFGKV